MSSVEFDDALYISFNLIIYLMRDSSTFGIHFEVAEGTKQLTESHLIITFIYTPEPLLHSNFWPVSPASGRWETLLRRVI